VCARQDGSGRSNNLAPEARWHGCEFGAGGGAKKKWASEIVERLDRLANKRDPRAASERYRLDYDRHQDDLLQQESFYQLSSYQKKVWTVWDTTLEAIDVRYGKLHVRGLLTFLAHFDRGNIQDEVFRLASLGLPGSGGVAMLGRR
jgi:hypothetical protein